jgi:hypothetical protein
MSLLFWFKRLTGIAGNRRHNGMAKPDTIAELEAQDVFRRGSGRCETVAG